MAVKIYISFPGQPHFTTSYNGRPVSGSVGSSVNFTWIISGGAGDISWGLKESVGNGFAPFGILVTINSAGVVSYHSGPPGYSGHVSASYRSIGPSSTQAIFTLSSIQTSDGRYYLCKLDPGGLDDPVYDSVLLVVEGR